ncbi:hypothetical protein [Chitinivorax tropicus]
MGRTLPAKKGWMTRLAAHPAMIHYHRLAFMVAVVNGLVLIVGATAGQWWGGAHIRLEQISNMVLINLSMAILVRQQHVVNLLFWLATRAPTSWPLRIRWHLGKVYHFGGLHSAGAVAGVLWFAVFVGSLVVEYGRSAATFSGLTLLSGGLLLHVLLLLVMMALPGMRARFHDLFERTHRFGGWSALVLLWLHSLSLARDLQPARPWSEILLLSPSFWCMALVTFSIILPWLHLRKVPVQISKPSSHAVVLQFDYGVTPFPGSSTTISLSPLLEWHAFANIPAPKRSGFRLVVSRAGDWTGKFIDNPPDHVWVRGIPTAGVANIERLFKRVVYVATGSGIGPVLPHLLAKQLPMRLVWVTRNARKTYGDALVNEIMAAEPFALIWDTDAHGKPDMLQLAYGAYKTFSAEAVICISNQKLTMEVVHGLEAFGIPAYGAIWDS